MSSIIRSCRFDTDRLLVKEWHSLSGAQWDAPDHLAGIVRGLLTPEVTRSLPESWHGTYSLGRAREWIAQRDLEGSTLLVLDRACHKPLGLLILFEIDPGNGRGVEIHLGYLLAEPAWGKGLASELIGGFVAWCRNQDVALVVGGVEPGNIGSRRVLEKNGFSRQARSAEPLFELRLSPAAR
jgi:RimJ/RimL family protein N-acetyltransferase